MLGGMPGPRPGPAKPRLALTTCTTCDILCERRPTVQALEHLLREAQGHIEDGDSIEVTGRRRRRPAQPGDPGEAGVGDRGWGSDPLPAEGVRPLASTGGTNAAGRARGLTPLLTPYARLRIILARLLLEVQGAKLTCTIGEDASAGPR